MKTYIARVDFGEQQYTDTLFIEDDDLKTILTRAESFKKNHALVTWEIYKIIED